MLVQQYSDAPDKVEVVKVSVRMQFVCEMMHVSLGQELGERVKHTKRLHLSLTKAIYHPILAEIACLALYFQLRPTMDSLPYGQSNSFY